MPKNMSHIHNRFTAVCIPISIPKTTMHPITDTHNRFTALLEYVQDHPGEQIPER